jgi:hypothetical protein
MVCMVSVTKVPCFQILENQAKKFVGMTKILMQSFDYVADF